MARPASYMSENVDFRLRWTSVKPLGENIDPNTRIWLFNHVSTKVLGDSSFFTNRNTLSALERLLEAIRGVGKLSLLLLESPSSSMEVLPLLDWRVYACLMLVLYISTSTLVLNDTLQLPSSSSSTLKYLSPSHYHLP